MNSVESIMFNINTIITPLSSASFHAHAVLGAVVIWVFSWLWHDFIFVKPWLKWTGMSLAEAQALHKGKLIQDLGLYLVSKIVLSYFCMLLGLVFQVHTINQACLLALLISIGIVFPSGAGPVIFERRNVGLWVLSSGLLSVSVVILLLIQLIEF